MSGRKIEFRGVGSRLYPVVLRVDEPPWALRGDLKKPMSANPLVGLDQPS